MSLTRLSLTDPPMSDELARIQSDVRRLELENAALKAPLHQGGPLAVHQAAGTVAAPASGPPLARLPAVSARRRWFGRRVAAALLLTGVATGTYFVHGGIQFAHRMDVAFTTGFIAGVRGEPLPEPEAAPGVTRPAGAGSSPRRR